LKKERFMTQPNAKTLASDKFFLDLNQLSLANRNGISDRGVISLHTSLKGQKILLFVSGGIAAYKTPGLIRMLRSYGASVDVRLTESATEFIGKRSLEWAAEDGQVSSGNGLSGEVEHLAHYSLYLLAPATYNVINGIATGRGDTPVFTTMATALGRMARGEAKVLILPCMNGDMSNPIFLENVYRLKKIGVEFITPRMDRGKLEYPGSEFITVATTRSLSKSCLKNSSILLTAGPTPVAIDDVRRITNIFKGKLGLEIAKELVIRGSDPSFILGGSLGVPEYLKPFTTRYSSYEQYKDLVLGAPGTQPNFKFAILSSAVADYRPEKIHLGKISSKASSVSLPPLVPTEKVVDLLHLRAPQLPIISFKLLSRVTEAELLTEARSRLSTHSEMVVANRLEDCIGEQQTVHLVTQDETLRATGSKRQVAIAIVDAIEKLAMKRK
jgi:phosphopantothenoylcysteine decarboxylase / phosphopantothenate---cysteine ligase